MAARTIALPVAALVAGLALGVGFSQCSTQNRLLGIGVPELARWPTESIVSTDTTVEPGQYVVAEVVMDDAGLGDDNSTYLLEFTSTNKWVVKSHGYSTAVRTGKGSKHDRMLIWFQVRGDFTAAEKAQGDQTVTFKVKSVQAGSAGTNPLSFTVNVQP